MGAVILLHEKTRRYTLLTARRRNMYLFRVQKTFKDKEIIWLSPCHLTGSSRYHLERSVPDCCEESAFHLNKLLRGLISIHVQSFLSLALGVRLIDGLLSEIDVLLYQKWQEIVNTCLTEWFVVIISDAYLHVMHFPKFVSGMWIKRNVISAVCTVAKWSRSCKATIKESLSGNIKNPLYLVCNMMKVGTAVTLFCASATFVINL